MSQGEEGHGYGLWGHSESPAPAVRDLDLREDVMEGEEVSLCSSKEQGYQLDWWEVELWDN